MQAVNETSVRGAGRLAANGRMGASDAALKADFAAMLSDLADPQSGIGSGSLGGIFSAMKELRDQNASLCADISCKKQDLKRRSQDGASAATLERSGTSGAQDGMRDEDAEVSSARQDDGEHEAGSGEEEAHAKTAADVQGLPEPEGTPELNAHMPEIQSPVPEAAETAAAKAEPDSDDEALEGWFGALMDETDADQAVSSELASGDVQTEDALPRSINAKSLARDRSMPGSMAAERTQAAGTARVSPDDAELGSGQLSSMSPAAQDEAEAGISIKAAGDSGLAVMMARAGVTSVSLKESPEHTVSALSDELSADLELIDDSLQAAAALSPEEGSYEDADAQAWYSRDGSQGYTSTSRSSSSQGTETQNQSVTQALAALRAHGGEGADAAGVQKAPVAVAVKAGSANAEAEVSSTQSGRVLEGTAGAVLPGTGEISQSRQMSREGNQSMLREQMMTLSRDVRKNAEEISKAVMTMAARNLKRLSFELNPQGLGRMEISIDADAADDAVKVNLAAESSVTRQLLSQGLSELKDSLSRAGLAADAELEDYRGSGQGGQQDGAGHGGAGQEHREHTFFASRSANEGASADEDQAAEETASDDKLSLYA